MRRRDQEAKFGEEQSRAEQTRNKLSARETMK